MTATRVFLFLGAALISGLPLDGTAAQQRPGIKPGVASGKPSPTNDRPGQVSSKFSLAGPKISVPVVTQTPTAKLAVTAAKIARPAGSAPPRRLAVPVIYAPPSMPRPTDSLVVDKRAKTPLTSLEYAATLRAPLGSLKVSSPYGPRVHPVVKRAMFHHGIDYVAPSGTPIRAAQDGVIAEIRSRSYYGRYLRMNHGHGVETVYGHLLKYMPGLKAGSIVRRGDVIGFVGASGRVTGPHLHFEVLANGEQVDPMQITMAFAPDRLLSMK